MEKYYDEVKASEYVEKYISEYPGIEDEKFPEAISTYKEFAELRLGPEEQILGVPGKLLKQQEFIRRFMSPYTPYDKVLLFQGPGTGKCVLPSTTILIKEDGRERFLSIEELWNSSDNDTIYDGEGHWKFPKNDTRTLSFREGNMRERKIVRMYRQRVDTFLKVVETTGGIRIVCTLSHKILTPTAWKDRVGLGEEIVCYNRSKKRSHTRRVEFCDIKEYHGYVYDLEVDEDHNYVCYTEREGDEIGIIAHNTCAASAVAETFKYTFVDGKPRKQTIILVKSEDIKKNFVKEISEVCTAGQYLPNEEDISERSYELKTNKLVYETYKISTFRKFLKKLPEDKIFLKKEYSERLYVIDEAHLIHEREEGEKMEDKGRSLYEKLWSFLHTIENSRVILATGTPIWDKMEDVATLMNLITEKQVPIGKEFVERYYDKKREKLKNTSELAEIWKGRISFLRPMISDARRIYEGRSEPWLKFFKIYPSVMSDFQFKVSEEARGHTGEGKKVKGGAILRTARDAMNFVYPSGEYGSEAFRKYIARSDKVTKVVRKEGLTERRQIQKRSYSLSQDIKDAIRRGELGKLSCKFQAIYEEILNNPKESIFIYSEFVTGAGAILLGLILQQLKDHNGERFIWLKNPINLDTAKKAPRFVVITMDPETTSKSVDIRKMLDVYNDPRNKYGEYIRLIIGSEKISLGLTLKHTRQCHVLMSHWNIPAVDQAIGRVLRIGAHSMFENPEERYIKIFFHAAVKALDDPFVTTDIYVYKIAEKKDIRSARLYRFMKIMAFDCAINYKRNVLESDMDNSRECDYTDCNYKCFCRNPSDTSKKVWDYVYAINPTNYNLLYSIDDIMNIITETRNLFKLKNLYSIGEIFDALKYDRHLVLDTMDIIIGSRLQIRNRLGFLCYLREYNNVYFLDSNFLAGDINRYESLVYIDNPMLVSPEEIGGVIEKNILSRERRMICDVINDPSNISDFSYYSKIILLENCYKISRTEDGEKKRVCDAILKTLGRNITEIPETGDIVHNMYNETFSGTSYNVIAKHIKANGMMRIYDKDRNEWKFLTNEKKEKEYIERIKSIQQEKKKKYLQDNPYGFFGHIEKDGKFRIQITEQKGRFAKKGVVCGTGIMNAEEIIRLLIRVGSLPRGDEKFDNLPKKELIKTIKNNKYYEVYKKETGRKLYDETEEYLGRLLTLFRSSMQMNCQQLRQWLDENNLLLVMS